MNAVNPTLRTRHYKELTRRRKRSNGAVVGGDDFEDDLDNDDNDDDDALKENENLPQDLVSKSTRRTRDDGLDGIADVSAPSRSTTMISGCNGADRVVGFTSVSESTSVGSGQVLMKLDRSDDAFEDSSAGFEDSNAGLSMDSGGAFLGNEVMGVDFDCLPEGGSGGGTKMYTPAQKKAIVEYAVQYGERAAAKKFGVHRKNIYRFVCYGTFIISG